MSQDIVNQVERIRKLRGKSQTEAAKWLGIKQPDYSKRVAGKGFSGEELKKLGQLYNVPIQAFYTDEVPNLTLVAEPHVAYQQLDITVEGQTGRFVLVMRRYMADNNINTVKDMAERMQVGVIYLTSISSGNKPMPLSILTKAVKYCKFNANFILCQKGDYFISQGDMKGMIAEMKTNFERSLSDKNKLIQAYETLMRDKGIKF